MAMFNLVKAARPPPMLSNVSMITPKFRLPVAFHFLLVSHEIFLETGIIHCTDMKDLEVGATQPKITRNTLIYHLVY
jgi:hypothetical protein